MNKADQERDSRIIQHWLFQVTRTTLADYWRIRSRVSTCSLEELLDTALRMGVSQANVKVLQFRAIKRAAAVEDNVLG